MTYVSTGHPGDKRRLPPPPIVESVGKQHNFKHHTHRSYKLVLLMRSERVIEQNDPVFVNTIHTYERVCDEKLCTD